TLFRSVNWTLFFSAWDDTHGTELWKSDGTATGTVLVKDISAGSLNGFPYISSPCNLTNVNGTLFFSADDRTHWWELWKSDGTAAGTVLVKDIYPGGPSYPGSLTNVNGTRFFSAWGGTHGVVLWESDATAAGTTLAKDIFPGGFTGYFGGYYINSSHPGNLTNVNGTLFFTALGADGNGLWKSDGTEAGTVLAKEITYAGFSYITSLTNVS